MAATVGQPAPPVSFYPSFLGPEECREWFAESQSLNWRRDEITIYGKSIPAPREEALFGDDLTYRYRDETIKALPWPDFLREARNRITALTGCRFHFAVGNRYLSGKDSIGWHADDFPQIEERPAIASLSLGGQRRLN